MKLIAFVSSNYGYYKEGHNIVQLMVYTRAFVVTSDNLKHLLNITHLRDF